MRIFLALLMLIALPFAAESSASALAIGEPGQVAAIEGTPAHVQGMEEERERRTEAEFDKAIAEAKFEVTAAGNSRLENWIGFYGILITVVLALAAFFTWRAAANAARAEVRAEVKDIRDELSALAEQAKLAFERIQINAETADEMTEALKERLAVLPGTKAEPLSPEIREEAERFATVAAGKPPALRTASDLRVLMFEAVQNSDWIAALAFVEEYVGKPDANQQDRAYALFYRAYALDELGRHADAANAYREYFAICPDDSSEDHAAAYSNWGNALHNQVKGAEGPGIDEMFREAIEKYKKALELNPNMHSVLSNWGYALIARATQKMGVEKSRIFDEAEKILLDAEGRQLGVGSYNLACLHALRGDADRAAQWLKSGKAADSNFPDCDHVTADTDFDGIRGELVFQQALKDIGCG